MRWSAIPTVVIAVAVLRGGARAGDADPGVVSIEVASGVPFSAGELRTAVALRGIDVALTVRPGGREGSVVVVVDDRERAVLLAGLRGAAAARKVALLVLDLLEPRPAATVAMTTAVAIEPTPTEAPAPFAPAGDRDRGGAAGLVDEVRPLPRWLLRAQGGAAAGEGLRLALSIDHAIAGPLALVAGGGVTSAVDAPAAVTMRRVPLWLGAGVAVQRRGVVLDAHLAALASIDHLEVDDGGATRSHLDVEWGGTTDLGLARRLGGHAALGLRAGIDAYATRTEYHLGGELVTTSPRLVPWLALSLSLSLEAR